MRSLRPVKQAAPTLILSVVIALLPFKLSAGPQDPLNTEVITKGIKYPWGMTWVNEHKLLVTEKTVGGWIVDINKGQKTKVTGWPQNIMTKGQGGLLDVLSDPQFTQNKTLYFSYSHKNPSNDYTTRVASAQLDNSNQLINWKVLFTALPYSGKTQHFGSRLAIQNNHLFVSVGDRGERDRAQDLSDHAGKIHRIKTDGSVPQDNPFSGKTTASGQPIPASIYSYGHRNPQGMVIDNKGTLWIHEHGPRGGDELNQVIKGENYGWPVITYGREYWGPSIGEGTHKAGMQQPNYYYVPSIAPSGLIRYEGQLFKAWQGDFVLGALRGSHLNRLTQIDNPSSKALQEHRYLEDLDLRIRDIELGPKGAIYIVTDQSNGQLIKVTP